MALIELADLAAFLQQDLDTASATVARTIATGVVVGYTGQNFESQSYSHTLPVYPGSPVVLPQRPVLSVSAVSSESGPLTSDEWTWLAGSPWLTLEVDAEYVLVTYTAGYAAVPDAVKAVTLAVAARAYSNAVGLRSESIDDYSITYAGGGEDLASVGLTKPEQAILSRFRAGLGSVVPR